MIAWLITSWPAQVAYAALAAWFLNGLRKAVWRPRLTLVSMSSLGGQRWLMTVRRQQLLPPWGVVDETWLLTGSDAAYCEQTGRTAGLYDMGGTLLQRLVALRKVASAREEETEELSRKTRP